MDTYTDSISELLAITSKRVAKRQFMKKRFSLLLNQNKDLLKAVPLVVKVAGTNGKGSLCAMLNTHLLNNKIKTGLFTSPHLSRITERFIINGKEVSPSILETFARKVKREVIDFVKQNGSDYLPSFFEVLILLALNIFADERVDVAILEAGVGGYNDSTSLIPAMVSVITSIGLDHKEQLGTTPESVATDKAGIATNGSILVLGPGIKGKPGKIIREDAKTRGITLHQATTDTIIIKTMSLDGTTVHLGDTQQMVKIPLAGEFQVYNFSTLRTLLAILPKNLLPGLHSQTINLESTVWPGRLETIAGEPTWLLDAAHNRHAFETLSQTLPQLLDPANCILLYGSSKDKEYEACLPYLPSLATGIYLTDDFYRSEQVETLAKLLPPALTYGGGFHSIAEAVETITKDPANKGKTIIATGSIFMVGKLREHLRSMIQTTGQTVQQAGRCHPSIMGIKGIQETGHPGKKNTPRSGEIREVISDLMTIPKFGNGIGLHRMDYLCSEIMAGDWMQGLDALKVTGSNGKGSVCAMAASILGALGIGCGLYTSPHLKDFNERISVDGIPISDGELVESSERIFSKKRAYSNTFPADTIGAFEAFTFLALDYFSRHCPETLVSEAGIGGRYDSTRIIPGSIVGLTSLDLEHTGLLGNSLELIAYDKADLCVEGGTLVTGHVDADVARRLRHYCGIRNIKVVNAKDVSTLHRVEYKNGGMIVDLDIGDLSFRDLRIGLCGKVQVENAVVAVEMVRRWLQKNRPDMGSGRFIDAVTSGLANIWLKGRFHLVGKDPDFYIDTAHTPGAVKALTETVQVALRGKQILLLTGVSHDKNVEGIVSGLLDCADAVVCTRAYHRGGLVSDTAAVVQSVVEKDKKEIPCFKEEKIEDAVAFACKYARENDMTVLAAGGLFLAVEAMQVMKGENPRDVMFF